MKIKYTILGLLVLLGCKKDIKSISASDGANEKVLLNYAKTTACPQSLIKEPKSIEELKIDVKSALQSGHKLMTGTRGFRSEIDASCAAKGEVQILTTHLDNIEVDIPNKRVIAESGATLKEVLKAIEASGRHKFTIRSVSEGPFFTMGGMLGSGTHGSGTTFDATFADNVTKVWLIDGLGRERVIDESSPLMTAVRTNLGVLGVVTKVEVKLAPAVRLKATVESGHFASDSKEAVDYIKQKISNNDSVSIAWFPGIELRESKTKYVNSYSLVTYKETAEVPASDQGNFQGYYAREFMETSVRMFKLANKPSPSFNLCDMANIRIGTRYDASYFKSMDLEDKKLGVGKMKQPVGWAKDIEYFDCPEGYCAWDYIPIVIGGYSIPFAKLSDWMADVRSIIAKNYMANDPFCMPLNGVYLRFTELDKTIIAGGAKGDGFDDIVVHIDIEYTLNTNDEIIKNDPIEAGLRTQSSPPHQYHIYQEINQMSLYSPKYLARPHWGKNKAVAFMGAVSKYQNFSKFLDAKKQLDPNDNFQNPFWNRLLKEKTTDYFGCALNGDCLCTEGGKQCGDKFKCQKGLYYKNARVCR